MSRPHGRQEGGQRERGLGIFSFSLPAWEVVLSVAASWAPVDGPPSSGHTVLSRVRGLHSHCGLSYHPACTESHESPSEFQPLVLYD